jgi:copper homeostasis protein
MSTIIQGRVVIPGQAAGWALVANEPLSFWGGYDYHTGEIIDRRHPLSGQIAAGRVLCLPFTRGSSTTTAVLLEAVKAGTAPAAIITTGVDTFFALASIVADAMYGQPVPLIALSAHDFAQLRTGDLLAVDEDGRITRSTSEVFRDLGGLASTPPAHARDLPIDISLGMSERAVRKPAERAAPAVKVEICIEAASEEGVKDAVRAAYLGGAATVELCSTMHLDGLTPDPEYIIAARQAFGNCPGLMVMVRPRAGDFRFSPAEVELMLQQIEMAAAAGANGVVLGVLRPQDNRIAVDAMKMLVSKAKAARLKTSFHRAFDATPDAGEALDALIDLGLDRVLTSGISWGVKGTALDGVERLVATIRRSQGRIEIVLAGGIGPANVGLLLARLPLAAGLVSVHAYSGAQANGQTTVESVRALFEATNQSLT